jgi:glucose/arabinose dehydrogenase
VTPLHRLLGAAAACALLAGCTAAAQGAAPTWVPKPSFSGEGQQPGVEPVQPQAPSSAPSNSPNTAPRPSGSATSNQDPAVVATKLTAPDAIAVLPDNTAIVGERTTGRIVLVQPQPGKPVKTVRTLSGIDPSGDGGLLDLALSPNYLQDSLVFAYVTTRTDNRVIAFTLTGPVTTVITGIPRGATNNVGHIAFTGPGDLYIATGDAGRPSAAADPNSLAGKVLRVSEIGRPSTGNPVPASATYARGLHLPAGLCVMASTGLPIEVDVAGTGGAGALDEINLVQANADYGWPTPTRSSTGPIAELPKGQHSPGGCTVLDGVLYVTSLDGQSLLSGRLAPRNGTLSVASFSSLLQRRYGRLLTVVAAGDGALWLTTSNKDGKGKPTAADERVLRIVPQSGGAATFPG